MAAGAPSRKRATTVASAGTAAKARGASESIGMLSRSSGTPAPRAPGCTSRMLPARRGPSGAPMRMSRSRASEGRRPPAGVVVKASGSVTISVPPARTQSTTCWAKPASRTAPRGIQSVLAAASRAGSRASRMSESKLNEACSSSPSRE